MKNQFASSIRLSLLLGLILQLFPAMAQTNLVIIDQFNPSGIGANSYANGQIGNVWKNWFGNAFQSWPGTPPATPKRIPLPVR